MTLFATRTTIATGTTVTTLATLRTRTTLALYIALRLFEQHAVRKLILASLRVNLHELNLQLVALFDASLFNSLQTFPVNLRDVQQAVLARHNLYEAAVRHD